MKFRSIHDHKGTVVGEPSVLIVEDDFIVAKVIEKSLLELGYRIAGMVGTGREAVSLAEEDRPDIILMDINLQGDMDGITAADTIHSRQDIPVVFLTAFSDQTTFSRALETSPYGYIIKPFQAGTLGTTIQVALNKHRLEEQQAARNQWLEGTLRSFSDGVITVDTRGIVTLINRTAEQMTGWTAGEAQGQPLSRVLMFTDPRSGKRGGIATAPVVAEGIVTTVPEGVCILTKGGFPLPVGEAIASPVRNDAGTITGAAVVIYPKEEEPAPPRPGTGGVARPVPAPAAMKPAAGNKPDAGLKKQPVTADDWIDRGNALIFLRRYGDAVKAYDRAIAINPTNYQAWYGKGTALSKTGNTEGSLQAYDRALSIHPRNHQILMAKGVLLRKIGNDSEADRCFELANLYTF